MRLSFIPAEQLAQWPTDWWWVSQGKSEQLYRWVDKPNRWPIVWQWTVCGLEIIKWPNYVRQTCNIMISKQTMRSEGNGKCNPLKVTGGLDFGKPRSNPNPDCKSKQNSSGLQHLDSPCGRPSHTSSQSYLHSPSEPCKGSFSRSNVRKVRVTSMWGGTMMMKVHSRLWGYLSGKPGDSITPDGLVKFLEQSEPGGRENQKIREDSSWNTLYVWDITVLYWPKNQRVDLFWRDGRSTLLDFLCQSHTKKETHLVSSLRKTYWCERKREHSSKWSFKSVQKNTSSAKVLN